MVGRKKGFKHSEETKLKISENSRINPNYGMKGKKHSEKTISKMREKTISEEQKTKLRTLVLGRKHSEETRKKISLGNKGKKLSEEHKKILSLSNKGHKVSKETRRKMSVVRMGYIPWNKGKKLSEEHKRNIGITGKGRIVTKETRDKISKAFTGEKHPLWLGGKSFEPYNENFNKKFKNQIRKRDNQVCMTCGIHREKIKRAFDVHHINYDKLLSIPQNCIALCNSCHTKTGFNRKYWITFFQNLLTERYGYNYLENKDIILEYN